MNRRWTGRYVYSTNMVTAQADLHLFVIVYIKCRFSHEEAGNVVINHRIIAKYVSS